MTASVPSPAFAVIIPHYNDVVRLTKCLTALCSDGNGETLHDVEVVVVDNKSTQSLDTLKSAFPAVEFVVEPEKGAAAARNRGVRSTTAAKLFFLDADCVPTPSWLAEAKRASADPGADIVGGRIETFDETLPPRSGAEAFETVFAFQQETYVNKKGFSVTANLVTSRTVFEDTGDFIVGLSEDFDWCQRARSKGYRLVYDDRLVVCHPTRQDWPALSKKWKRLADESFHLNGTSVSARIKWGLRAGAVLLSVVPHALKVLTNAELDGITERRRGLMTLLRLRVCRFAWMIRQAATGE
ncbi:glycosyltransferase family 2 protein [Roseibium album]|uniref:glycosyltransferase family 2 protein n=1 Tax=Roseibium album TaxID=311410 RepID=UPI002493B063|nr:glycosyltransferase [Roseibium album]